jgi:hypothetical protein
LSITSIAAFKKFDGGIFEPYQDDPNRKAHIGPNNEKSDSDSSKNQGWLGWLIGYCGEFIA